MSKKLEVRLLGKFDVRGDSKAIAIPSRPAQSLFAYLILHAGMAHRREKLAGLLWPDSLEETARDNLRHALWRLRKVLPSSTKGDYLLTDDLSIRFNDSAEYWLDAAALKKLHEDASTDELMSVLSEFHGELLPGFYDEWVVLEREHLSSVFEHHMARLMSLLQEEKRWLDILNWGERWIKFGQQPEPAYRALMNAHAAKGDMSKVAAMYERCVKSLREYGMEPSEQTRALYEKLKMGKATLESTSAISEKVKRVDLPKTNLPVPLTSFIGREKEVDHVIKMLAKKRLVTLTGSGGVGKTRLAIQSSHKLSRKFRDGVWWVDLVGLNDNSLVLQAVAQVVNVRELPNQSLLETLVEHIGAKQALLILDNCEHLITGCAQLADKLLSACENLTILATSREVFGLIGEEVWQVPALSLPDPQEFSRPESLMRSESITLFVERAVAVNSRFTVTDRNALRVAQICQRLDGIPLAIELAAARVKVLPVDQIAARLDDRFDLLTSGSRTAFPRHQTLRAAIDWSYDLLPEKEQTLFCRLAVFIGGWNLEAAQVVCSGTGIESYEILDLLTYLVDKSLVIVHRQEGAARFQMLETIREYALKKLPELPEARDRHLAFFVQLAEEIEPRLHGTEQGLWLNRLELEHDNIRSALEWALSGGSLESGLRLAGALWLLWDVHGYHLEGRVWLDRLLDRYDDVMPVPVTPEWARILYVAGHLRQRQGDFDKAREYYSASLALYRQLQDQIQVAVVLRGLGEIAQDEGDLSSAKDYFEQSLKLFRSLEDEKGTGIALNHLATLALLLRDYEQATVFSTEALVIGRNRGDHRTTAIALTTLGFALCGKGELDSALTRFTEALALQTTLADKRITQYPLMGMALVAFTKGEARYAARLFGAADAMRERIDTPLPPSQQPFYDSLLRSVRAELDEETFQSMWEDGRSFTLQQAIEFALRNLG